MLLSHRELYQRLSWPLFPPFEWLRSSLVNHSVWFCSTGSCTSGRSRNRRTWVRVCASSRRRWGRTTDPASDRWRCGRTWSACWSVSGTASSCPGGWAAGAWGEGACTENSPPLYWRRTAWSCKGLRVLMWGTTPARERDFAWMWTFRDYSVIWLDENYCFHGSVHHSVQIYLLKCMIVVRTWLVFFGRYVYWEIICHLNIKTYS